MKWHVVLSFALLAASSCGRIPADPGGTLERVHSEGVFRVGMMAGGVRATGEPQRRFIKAVSSAVGATPRVESGSMETLLVKLENGELDIVIGELAPKSPWSKRVNILPPLAEKVDKSSHAHVVAITRNGENAWVTALHPLVAQVRARI